MKTPEKLLQENMDISKKEFLKNVEYNMKKCTVCGRYGLNREVNDCKIIKGKIYTHICKSCTDLLSNNKFTKNINYEVDFIEDLVYECDSRKNTKPKDDDKSTEIVF